jgi:hypothetical protein
MKAMLSRETAVAVDLAQTSLRAPGGVNIRNAWYSDLAQAVVVDVGIGRFERAILRPVR